MKKRKLTRKSLDELAKVMPVLSEDEQRTCIGGTHFYDYSGNYLGNVGPGEDIRIVKERSVLDSLKMSESYYDPNFNTSSRWGDSPKEAFTSMGQSPQARTEAMTRMYNHVIGGNMANVFGEIVFTSGSEDNYDMRTSGVTEVPTPFHLLEIDLAKMSVTNAGYFRSTYGHEVFHALNHGYNSTDDKDIQWQRENAAYTAQTSVDGFKNLSLAYRMKIYNAWSTEYSKANSGPIPASIKKACGID